MFSAPALLFSPFHSQIPSDEHKGSSQAEANKKKMDEVFLCRYPDEEMPLHKARLTSELDQCTDKERRKMTDALYGKEA